MDWFDSVRAFFVSPPGLSSFDDYLGTIKALKDQRADAIKNRNQGAMKRGGELPFKFLDKEKKKKEPHEKKETQEAVERGSLEAAKKVAELQGNPIMSLDSRMAEAVNQLKAIKENTKKQKKVAVAKI